jgi:DNA-binding NarL/FixJ family response regulator
MGTSQETGERALWEPYLVAASSQLDGAAWDTAWAEGEAMGLEEIMQYALSEEELATTAQPTTGQAPVHKPPPLTHREEEVATLVACGFTNRQIASALSVSEHTVANYVAKILRKLGFISRSQITAWVVEQRTSP